MDLATVGLGPSKTASFKPLREQPDSVLRSPENLYQIAPTAPEDVDVAAQLILLKRCLHLRCQPMKPASHISDTSSDPDARARR